MPFAVDEDKMQGKGQHADSPLVSLDPHHPPTKQIPFMEFPRIVYKHPSKSFTTIEHRNAKHEVVHEEIVPTEHLTMTVSNEEEFTKALEDGWLKEPHVQKPLPDKKAALYNKK